MYSCKYKLLFIITLMIILTTIIPFSSANAVTYIPLTIGITHNDALTATVTSKSYAFTLDSPCRVSINFIHAVTANSAWNVYLYDSNQTSQLFSYINRAADTDKTKYIGLPAGTYYITVASGSSTTNVAYGLTVNTILGNFEQESNDTIIDATPISLGDTYTGNIQPLEQTSRAYPDYDYYKFTINAASKVGVRFLHPFVATTTAWNIYILNSSSSQILTFQSKNDTTDIIEYIDLQPGTYYLKVTGASSNTNIDYSLNLTSIYSVTPNSGANGTISPNSVQLINSGSKATFTITPNSGFIVNLPIGGTCPPGTYYPGSPSSSYTTGTITNSCSVSPTFSAIYSLTVSILGDGSGSVRSSSISTGIPNDISCSSGSCSANYLSGSLVTLTATPNDISVFNGWTGSCVNEPCTVTMTGIRNVSAKFISAPKVQNITTNTPYISLVTALSLALPDAEIWMLDIQHDGVFSLDKGVKLKGGWDATYKIKTGVTSIINGGLAVTNGESLIEDTDIKGTLKVKGGRLRVINMRISQ